jgi:hypothetical protein
MQLDALKFGTATAIASAIAWLICSLVVWSMPTMTLAMGGSMMHMDLSQFGWRLTPAGVLAGLVAWSIVAGIFGWLLAAIYNRLL